MNKETLGMALYNLRTRRYQETGKERFKSARAFSLWIGKNTTYINNIEAGKNYPRVNTLLIILCELGYTLEDLDAELKKL